MCNNNWQKSRGDGRCIQPSIGSKSDGCFIATEMYGDSQANEVNLLRLYRDVVMNNSFIGKRLINFYYGVSPTLVKFIRKFPITKKVISPVLNTIVTHVNKKHTLRKEECDISIQYNTGCNLDCKLCFRKHDTVDNNKHINQNMLLSFIDRYSIEKGIEWIIWEGRGELFADDTFCDILNLICAKYPDIIHTVITNGTIDKLEQILYPENIYLSVSLDGLKEVHDYNRGIGIFERTIAFIQHALSMGFANITIRSIATKQFLSQLIQFSDFIYDLSPDMKIYVQEMLFPFNSLININNHYVSRDEIEIICKNITNVMIEKGQKHLHKQISLHPEGIFNCNKPTSMIGNYNNEISDILNNYVSSMLDCKNCSC